MGDGVGILEGCRGTTKPLGYYVKIRISDARISSEIHNVDVEGLKDAEGVEKSTSTNT